jgi:hypothetical protein
MDWLSAVLADGMMTSRDEPSNELDHEHAIASELRPEHS